jgi:subtilisin-like proprotein convertase family protein
MSVFNLFNSWRRSGKARRPGLKLERLERREVLDASQLFAVAGGTFNLAETFQLHSNPSANHTIYLDFDGHTTGNVQGSSWDNLTSPAWDLSGNGASFTDAERQTIQKVWARVAEDFAPFNVNVTTQEPANLEDLRKFGTGDTRWGIRVVITPDDRPAPGSGGVAYIGSFNYGNFTPAYVFNTSEKSVAEAASHEAGHALSLGHDGTATSSYYSGHGSGVTSWGPIMGASYNRNLTQWSRGEYANANNQQDDLAVITANNGFTYKTDDYGNTLVTATSLLPQGAGTVSAVYGVVERNTDSDYFSFYANAGPVSLTVDPLTIGPNLAVQADLYNASGSLLTTVNPAGAINAVVNYTLPASGQYFLRVSGTGKGSVSGTGFSNYGSLGNYRIRGTVTPYTSQTNNAPVAADDAASTAANTPVTVNVLANDSDPDGDPLTLTGVSDVVGGTAVVSNGQVIFTPAAGFSGTGSFTYSISDGRGGTDTAVATVTVAAPPATQSFTNNANVSITSSRPVTVSSSIVVSGLSGTVQDVNVSLNVYHTYDNDLRITLFAPDGTAVRLFNRHGGSSNNILGTTFDDAAGTAIGSGSAPFTGTFRPSALLSGLNGKAPNGTWRLQIEDLASQDGGYLDNWTLTVTTGPESGEPAGAAPEGKVAVVTKLPAGLPAFAPVTGFGGRQVSAAPSFGGAAPQSLGGWLSRLAETMVAVRRRQPTFHGVGEPEGDLPRG